VSEIVCESVATAEGGFFLECSEVIARMGAKSWDLPTLSYEGVACRTKSPSCEVSGLESPILNQICARHATAKRDTRRKGADPNNTTTVVLHDYIPPRLLLVALVPLLVPDWRIVPFEEMRALGVIIFLPSRLEESREHGQVLTMAKRGCTPHLDALMLMRARSARI
jgi:hypothetical protein